MVYFECDSCNETLKKKQVQTHYMSKCRRATSFSCLTCHNHFDRDSIITHTSCISEEEKYQKGDPKAQELLKKKESMALLQKLKDNIDELDFSKIEWKGFKKTSKEILNMINVKKISIPRLVTELSKIYARSKEVNINEVDEELVKKNLMDKIEDYDKFSIDLSKKIIKLKA